MKKSRHLYLHPETNPGKVSALESLHVEYVKYIRICVQHMLDNQEVGEANVLPESREPHFPDPEERSRRGGVAASAIPRFPKGTEDQFRRTLCERA